ncbi:MAG: CBS domain-containing protein [Planctomycetota bacterium]
MPAVKDIMTDGVVTIGPTATIGEAIELLLARRVSGLPVVEADETLVGIITEFALLGLAYDQAIMSQTVAEHMTRTLLTVEVDEPVSKVADLCIVHRVRRLPVLDGGRLVGLVSRRDVLEAICQPAPEFVG